MYEIEDYGSDAPPCSKEEVEEKEGTIENHSKCWNFEEIVIDDAC